MDRPFVRLADRAPDERLWRCCLHPFPHSLIKCVAWQYPPFAFPVQREAPVTPSPNYGP